MSKNISIAVVIPTYNEADNIRKLILQLNKVFVKSKINGKIIIVDDNSPDGTGKIAEKLSKEYNISVIHRKCKLGLGSAYVTGFKYVIEKINPDLIVSMDADFSHDPKKIPEFIEKINGGYDVVVGSRYIEGGGVSWGLHRIILSKGANLFAKTVLGFKVHDLTGAYRCYKKDVLKSINLTKITSNGFSFLEEILYLCKSKGYKIGEIPIFFTERKKGKSKLSKKEMINFFITILRLKIGW